MTSSSHARTAVVSGTSTGIGRVTARALAQQGWQVFAGVRETSSAPSADPTWSGAIEPLLLDVTDDTSLLRAASRVAQRLNGRPLTALVNNAGIGRLVPMEFVSIDDLRAVWDVNVDGAVRVTQAFLPAMTRGSRIVFVSSVGGRITPPYAGPLSASKAAVSSIAEAFRLELHARGVLVSIIEPGSIDTPAVDKIAHDAAQDAARIAKRDSAAARRFRAAVDVALDHERRGSSPDVVSSAITRCLDAARPRPRVLSGKGAGALAALAATLPERLRDRLLLRVFRQ